MGSILLTGNVEDMAVAVMSVSDRIVVQIRLRQIRMEHQGKLVSISGTITRTSQVRPELLYGTFECNDCSTIIRDVQQEFNYTQVITTNIIL